MASLLGTKLIDTLVGDPGDPNMINAKAGDDYVVGGKLDDTILGGAGNDYVWGDRGNDTVFGGTGNDTVYGSIGNDALYGGLGNDWMSGGKNDDVMFGGKGDDILFGNSGNDILSGGHGNDLLIGGTGNDILFGGAGDDVIKGGSGNDYILVSSGNDVMSGGSGNDVLDYTLMKGNLDINLGKHTATVGSGNALNHETVSGFDTIIGTTAGTDHVVGDRNANVFVSGGATNVFRGGLGDDTLVGGSGSDTYIITKKDIADGSFKTFVNFEVGNDKVDLTDFMKGHSDVNAEFRFLDVQNADGSHSANVQALEHNKWVSLLTLAGTNVNDTGTDHHQFGYADLVSVGHQGSALL